MGTDLTSATSPVTTRGNSPRRSNKDASHGLLIGPFHQPCQLVRCLLRPSDPACSKGDVCVEIAAAESDFHGVNFDLSTEPVSNHLRLKPGSVFLACPWTFLP